VLAWSVTRNPFGQAAEDWLQDASFAQRGTRATRTPLLIVGLDDESLRRLPKPMAAASPELAEVVRFLNQQKARVIGLDVFVPETLDDYDREPGLGGSQLGLAVAEAGNVVLPAAKGDGGRLVRPLTSWQTARMLGLVEVQEDADHFVRRQLLADAVDGENRERLGLAMVDAAGRASLLGDELRVDSQAVVLDPQGFLRINFLGPPGTVPVVPFHAVLSAARGGSRDLRDQHERSVMIEDAFVLIGATARSLSDQHATPYDNGAWRLPSATASPLMTGPELQMNIVATLADGAYITTPWWLAPLPQVVLLGAVLGAIYARVSLARGGWIALGHQVGWKGVALGAFVVGSWRVELLAMALTGVLAYASAFAIRWRLVRRMFGAVKSEAIARALEDDPGHLRLKGEERTITVLFSDIRGFTRFSEGHTAPQVVALLNAYFAAVVPAIEAEGGVVDKYMGDGIMALFGAPDAQPDHAARAVRSAIAMVDGVRRQSGAWERMGFAGMRIGVGVHTGTAVVGTIGSPTRLDYTAIGDTVNAAARIEAETKPRATDILLSETTHEAIAERERRILGIAPEPLIASLKGKDRPLALYRVSLVREES
jgi:class 3 adenylate cyclase